MKIDPNAPAFPVPGMPPVGTGDPRDGVAGGCDPQPGMTIRATMAMHLAAGILAGGMADGSALTSEAYRPIAKSALGLADVLLDELNEEEVA